MFQGRSSEVRSTTRTSSGFSMLESPRDGDSTVESLLEQTARVRREIEQWRTIFRDADFDAADHGAALSRVTAARTKLSQDVQRTLDDSRASTSALRDQLKQLWTEYQQTVVLIPKLLTLVKSEMEKRASSGGQSARGTPSRGGADTVQVPKERLQQLNNEFEALQRQYALEVADRQKLETEIRSLRGGKGDTRLAEALEAQRLEHREEMARLERDLRQARSGVPERESADGRDGKGFRDLRGSAADEVESLRRQLAQAQDELRSVRTPRSAADEAGRLRAELENERRARTAAQDELNTLRRNLAGAVPESIDGSFTSSPQRPVRGPSSSGLRRPDYRTDIAAQLEYAHGVVNSLQLVNASLNRSKLSLESELREREERASRAATLTEENANLQARVKQLEVELRQGKALHDAKRKGTKDSPDRPSGAERLMTSSISEDSPSDKQIGSPTTKAVAENARLTRELTRVEEENADLRARTRDFQDRLKIYESDAGSIAEPEITPSRRRNMREVREANADLANQRLRLELDATQERLRQALRDVSSKNDEVDRAVTEKSASISKLHEFELDLMHSHQDVKALQAQLRGKDGDVARLEERISQLTRQANSFEAAMRDATSQMQREIEAKVQLRNEMGALQRALEAARTDISTLETDLSRSRKKESTDQQSFDSMALMWQQEKAKLQAQFRNELESEQQRREDAIASHERILRDTQNRLNELRAENENLITDKKRLERQVKTDERILSDAETMEGELLRLRQTAKEAEWRAQQSQDALTVATQETKRWQAHAQELDADNKALQPLKEKYKDLTKETTSLADDNQRLEQQVKDCQRKVTQLAELERNLELLQQQHRQTQKEKAAALEANRLLQQEVAARTTSIHECQLEITRLRQEYAASLENQNRQAEEQANTGKELNNVKMGVVDLQGELAMLRKKYNAEVRQKDQLEAALASESAKLKETTTRLEPLIGYKEKFDLLSFAHNTLQDEAEDLKNRLANAEREVKAERRRIEELASVEVEAEETRQKLRLEQRDKLSVEERLQNTQSEHKTLQARHADTEMKLQGVEVRLAGETSTARLTQEHLSEKETELRMTKEQLQSLRTADAELAGLKELHAKVVAERNQLKNTVTDLQALQEEMARVHEANSLLRQERETLNRQLATAEHELQETRRKVESGLEVERDLDKAKEVARQQQREATSAAASAREALDATETELKECKRRIRAFEKTDEENAGLQDRLREITKETSALRVAAEAGRVAADDLESHRKRVASLLQEKSDLSSELNAKDVELRAMKEKAEQLKAVEDQLTALRQQHRDTVRAEDAAAILMQNLERQVAELQRRVTELTPLKRLTEDQQKELAEAHMEQQRSNEQIARLKAISSERDKLQEAYDELILRNDRVSQRLHSLETQTKDDTERLEEANANFARMSAKYKDAFESNKYLTDEVDGMLITIDKTTRQLAELKGMKDEADQVSARLADTMRENRALKDRSDRLDVAEADKDRLSKSISQEKHEMERLTMAYQDTVRDLDKVKIELSTARMELTALRDALNAREKAHDELASDKTKATLRAEQLRQEIAELKLHVESERSMREKLEATHSLLTQEKDRLDRVAQDASNVARQKTQLEHQAAAAQDRTSALQEESAALNERIRMREKEIASLRRDLEDSRAQTSEAERASELRGQDAKRLGGERDLLQHQLMEKESEVIRLRTELDAALAINSQREPLIHQLRADAELRAKTADAEADRLRSEIEQLNQKRDKNMDFMKTLKRDMDDDLQATKAELEDKVKKLKESQRLLTSALGQIKDLEVQLQAAKSGEGELSGAQRAMQERMDKLRSEKAALEAERSRDIEEHERLLADVRRQSLEKQSEIRSELGREIERLERVAREAGDKRAAMALDLATAQDHASQAEKEAIRRATEAASAHAQVLSDVSASQTKLASETAARTRAESRVEDLSTQLTILRDTMAKESATLEELRREHSVVVAKLDAAGKENKELCDALAQMTSMVKASSEENDQLVMTNEDVCRNLHKMSAIQEEAERMLSDATIDNQELLRQIEALSEQGGVLADSLRRSEKRIESSNVRVAELTRTNDDLATQLSQLKVVYTRTKQSLAEVSEHDAMLEKEVARLEAVNDELTKLHKKTERKLNANIADIDDLRSQKEDLQLKLREIKNG